MILIMMRRKEFSKIGEKKNIWINSLGYENQPVFTTRIYVLHKITIALKFMFYINSDLPIPAKKLQTPG